MLKCYSIYLFAFLLLSPLSITLLEVSGKPVDISLSDLILVLIPFSFIYVGLRNKLTLLLPAFLVFFYLSLAMIHSILEGGQLSNVISSLRFSKQFLLIAAGGAFFVIYKHNKSNVFVHVFFVISVVILFSDIVWGAFPRGCGYEGRWGGCFLGIDVYGFPNSSASYLAIGFLVILFLHSIKLVSINVTIFTFIIIALLSLLSLSRTSWVTLFLGGIGFLLFLRNPFLIFSYLSLLFITACLIVFNMDAIIDMPIFEGMVNKVAYYSSGNEMTSGRTHIWFDTLALWSEQPLFGYGFDYFSKYVVGFDTPHQQYLELLFKSGFFGTIIYLLLCCYTVFLLSDFLKYKANFDEGSISLRLLAIVAFPVAVNGLFQPILSYSTVANITMFTLGYLLEFNKVKFSEG
ncbi:MAG: O-antigen ligase family protein [Vibrio campbellii]|nr:O-antigen ligase family protein [Vibrio campbellii]